MSKFSKMIREHSVPLLTLFLGILGATVTFQQLQLQQLQLDLQRQELEFSVDRNFVSSSRDVIAKAEQQLVDDFFAQVFKYTQMHANTGYYQAINALVPMTATLPAQPFSARVVIHNKGNATSTKVRAAFELDRPISSYLIDSLEPSSIVKGGVGDRQLTIELDRIVAGRTVTLTIVSENPFNQSQSDRIIIDMPSNRPKGKRDPSSWVVSTSKGSEGGGGSTSWDTELPALFYMFPQAPNLNVIVTSTEGPGIRVQGSSGTSSGF